MRTRDNMGAFLIKFRWNVYPKDVSQLSLSQFSLVLLNKNNSNKNKITQGQQYIESSRENNNLFILLSKSTWNNTVRVNGIFPSNTYFGVESTIFRVVSQALFT